MRRARLESVKWGGVPHRRWDELWQLADGGPVVLWGPEGTPVREAGGRVWFGPRQVLMYLWPDRDYNVVTLIDPDGPPRFYCNVCLPPERRSAAGSRGPAVWRYVDLDLDLVVHADGASEVRDEDEFEANTHRFGYPEDVRRRALDGLRSLQAAVARRAGPFAPQAERSWLDLVAAAQAGPARPPGRRADVGGALPARPGRRARWLR